MNGGRSKWQGILGFIVGMPLYSQCASAGDIKILDNEVSVGLEYLVGWSSVTYRDSATAQSDGQRPISMLVGGEFDTEDYLGLGPQRVQADLTAGGSLAYARQIGVAPSLFATTSSSLSVNATGQRASAGGFAPSEDNYAFYDFEVSGSAVDYSLSYTRPTNGVLSLTGPNTNITLAQSTDVGGTLEPGIYNINAFHSSVAIGVGEGVSAAFSESGFTFAITFDDAATIIPVPRIESVEAGDLEVALRVAAVEVGSPVTSYDASCSDGMTTYTSTSATIPIRVSGLTNGIAYVCTITVTYLAGTSVASKPTASFIPEERIEPGLPIWLLHTLTEDR
jgi:hypothetical protein